MPYRSVRVSVLATSRFGLWKPLNIDVKFLLAQTLVEAPARLLGVQLDDELFVQLDLYQLIAFRQCSDAAFQLIAVYIHPAGRRRMRGGIAGGENRRVVFAGFAH